MNQGSHGRQVPGLARRRSWGARLARIALGVVAALAIVIALLVATVYYQGTRAPTGSRDYVAMGSSYAAGAGLGELAPGSLFACNRRTEGYPQQLAHAAGLALMDVSCAGATIGQVLGGGQYFQAPQVDAIGPDTRLVTLTGGGNDVYYIPDLGWMARGNRSALVRRLVGLFTQAPHPDAARDYEALGARIGAVVRAARQRAPKAAIVVTTYPTLLPAQGNCPALGLSDAQVELMRPVAARLAEVTRKAAQDNGAILVDMAALGAAHDACSAEPWVNGAAPASGEAFHPTLAGVQASAREIIAAAKLPPTR